MARVVSPSEEGEIKGREGHLLSPLGGNRRGKNSLPKRGGIKVGEGKRGLENFHRITMIDKKRTARAEGNILKFYYIHIIINDI